MCSLVDLPEEILIIIIKQLDIRSIYNLYKTCYRLRNIILMQGVIRICNLSLNTLATVKSLRLDMVKQISGHLSELNLCGVSDMTKSLLLPAIKRMKCLETLDVSYTKITILNLLELYKNCPTIKNIAINFQFKIPEAERISRKVLHDCQEVFKNFVNVHFVINPWVSILPLYILEKSSINTLKYSICDRNRAVFENCEIKNMFPFNHICIFILSWEFETVCNETWYSLLSPVNIDNIEYVLIEYNTKYSFCASQMFTKFLSDNYNITSFLNFNSQWTMHDNVAILIWNKKTTIFDELFFCNLKKRLREIITCEIEVADDQPLTSDINTHTFDWFNIIPVQADDRVKRTEKTEPAFKKSRSVPQCLLSYDRIFRDHENIKLSLFFIRVSNVTLSANSLYLKKLTYLSLKGLMVRYSNGFFNILFRCCENLVTLYVEGSVASPCCSPIMRSIPLSKSVKNIRLVDKRIDFNMLFSSFSQCTTLENIYVVDVATDFNNLADPTALFQRCSNLYSLYIAASMNEGSVGKKYQMLNNAKKNCSKNHLRLTLHSTRNPLQSSYDPYVHVFNLSPIKPV